MLPLRFLGMSMLKDIPDVKDGVIKLGRELLCSSSTSASSETQTTDKFKQVLNFRTVIYLQQGMDRLSVSRYSKV